jgi:hypothetical protein
VRCSDTKLHISSLEHLERSPPALNRPFPASSFSLVCSGSTSPAQPRSGLTAGQPLTDTTLIDYYQLLPLPRRLQPPQPCTPANALAVGHVKKCSQKFKRLESAMTLFDTFFLLFLLPTATSTSTTCLPAQPIYSNYSFPSI